MVDLFSWPPLSPYKLPLTITPFGSAHHQREKQSTQHLIQTLAQNQTQVSATLKAAQERAKQHHDRHRQDSFVLSARRPCLALDGQAVLSKANIYLSLSVSRGLLPYRLVPLELLLLSTVM